MAYGDAIMATALVRGFHAQGKLAAFGDGQTIKWTGYCESVFKHNPNIARSVRPGVVWLPHYKKNLTYCRYDPHQSRYIWNYNFKATPGEFFFAPDEPLGIGEPFIMIEPNVAWHRAVNVNKDWGEGKYEKLAKALTDHGYTVAQCIHSNSRRRLPGVRHLPTETFREAVCVMAGASLFIGPEGANHHAAAALNIPAIIVWGSWSPVQTMGYETQTCFTGGETQACGFTFPCGHCRKAMDAISVDEVYNAAIKKDAEFGDLRVR